MKPSFTLTSPRPAPPLSLRRRAPSSCHRCLAPPRAQLVGEKGVQLAEKKTLFNISIFVFLIFYASNFNNLSLQFQQFKSQMLNLFKENVELILSMNMFTTINFFQVDL
jgi:hypothetical protein